MNNPIHVQLPENPVKKAHRPKWLGFLIGCCFTLMSFTTTATLLPTDLKIFTSPSTLVGVSDFLSFDETGSSPATGNGTHSGSLVQTIGGISTTTTISDTTITSGNNPLSGALTDAGDGWEIHSAVNGSYSGGASATNNANVYDLFFNLQNLSATDSILVTLTLNFENQVFSVGPDAFSASEIQLFDGAGIELFFSDLMSDTVNGNQSNGIITGTSGGQLIDSGSYQLDLTLNPNDLLDFHIFHLIEGSAFESGSNYSAFSNLAVSFDARIFTDPPNPVPEPGALALFGIGLLGFLIGRRIKR